MRTADPVGLSEDGQSLIVKTGDGEQIAILADARLRQLLRDRPRPQLEIEMDKHMTPREIQMKIRAGASIAEIADASGMPPERVEAFAGPVIAEREHIAGLAQNGSVRRRGEPTGHRTLRLAISERLRQRGVDPDAVAWDAFKMEDGRWSISADYRIEDAQREAIFYFDQRGRFSVAGNDDARWAIGEQVTPAPGTSTLMQEEPDTEPTLRLSGPAEELALLRAVENDAAGDDEASERLATPAERPSTPGDLASAAPDSPATWSETPAAASDSPAASSDAVSTSDPSAASTDTPAGETPVVQFRVVEEVTVVEEFTAEDESGPGSDMDLLYDLLGHQGYAEESTRVYEGLTDAVAVPEVADSAWTSDTEPDQQYPAEPEPDGAESDLDDAESGPAESAAVKSGIETGTGAAAHEVPEAVQARPDSSEVKPDSNSDSSDPSEAPADDSVAQPSAPVPVESADSAESTDSAAAAATAAAADTNVAANGSSAATHGTSTAAETVTDDSAASGVRRGDTDDPRGASDTDHPRGGSGPVDSDDSVDPDVPVEADDAQPPASAGLFGEDPQPEAAARAEEVPGVAPDAPADEPTQDALPGADEPTAAKPAVKPKKRKRAAVPSWDEIMFGSPKSK